MLRHLFLPWLFAPVLLLFSPAQIGAQTAPERGSFGDLQAEASVIRQDVDGVLTEAEEERLASVLMSATLLRTIAALPEGLDAGLDGVAGAEVLRPLFTDRLDRTIWSLFLRGSAMMPGLAGAEKVRIGFYNPIVEGWLITDWRPNGAGRAELTDWWVATSDRFLDIRTPPLPRPRWTVGDAPPPTAMRIMLLANRRAFEKRYPLDGAQISAPPPHDGGDVTFLEHRLASQARSIAAAGAGPTGASVDAFLDALSAADGQAVLAELLPGDATAAARFSLLPTLFRSSLVPDALLSGEEQRLVLLGVPQSGHLFALLVLDRNGAIESATTFSLLSLEEGL